GRVGAVGGKGSIGLLEVAVGGVEGPVTLPPGRDSLAPRPLPPGSPTAAKTIGMTDVACFAAITDGVPCATMTSTFSRTNSAAISAARSLRPSAQRYSIVPVRPSIHPSSRSRCIDPATHLRAELGIVVRVISVGE